MNLYTLGYEGLTLDAFVQRLQALGVRRVVDVREVPISRKKGFSKTALRAALDEAGIAYTHMKPLGCPKPWRDYLKSGGHWAVYAQAFREHLATQSEALEDLVEIARAEPVGLLCFEADFRICHRSLVAKAVAARCRELKVIHADAKSLYEMPPAAPDFVKIA